jgi:transposase
MKLDGGIDLHSNNSVVALLDDADRVVYRKRLGNDAALVLDALAPSREAITGLVVESTYNWYWLVDALMDAGYWVHLANTAATVQYSGLKYSDDDSDAAWLAKLLRRRSRLVQQHTANVLAVQNLLSRNRGRSLSANAIRRLTSETVGELLPDANLALAVQSTLLAMRGQEAAIDLLEREACAQVKGQPAYRHLLSTMGNGQVVHHRRRGQAALASEIALVVALELGPRGGVTHRIRTGNDPLTL